MLVFAFEYLLCRRCLDRLKSRFTFGPFCFSYTEFASRQKCLGKGIPGYIEFTVTILDSVEMYIRVQKQLLQTSFREITVKLNYLDVTSILVILLEALANYFRHCNCTFWLTFSVSVEVRSLLYTTKQ